MKLNISLLQALSKMRSRGSRVEMWLKRMMGRPAKARVADIDIEVNWNNPILGWYESHPEYNGQLRRILERVPAPKGAVFLDVGANVGDTAALVRSVSEVEIFAFEGDDACASVLRRNSRALGSVNVVERFLGDRSGNVICSLGKEGWNTTLEVAREGATREVSVTTLDALGESLFPGQRVLGIKVDVEGWEFRVLRGAKSILRQWRPWLCLEYNPEAQIACGEDGKGGLEFLADMGYRQALFYESEGVLIGEFRLDERWVREDWDRYLRSRGAMVPYVDIVCVASNDEVWQSFCASERAYWSSRRRM